MKKKRINSILQAAGIAVLLLFCSMPIKADGADWFLVSHDANGETKEFPMAEIGSLVAVDDAYDFTILDASGNILAEGILKVTFEDKAASTNGLNGVATSGNTIGRVAKDRLTLMGVAGDVSVYSSDGVLQTKVKADGGETIVSIGHLSQGVYVVRVGKQTFKFVKQ